MKKKKKNEVIYDTGYDDNYDTVYDDIYDWAYDHFDYLDDEDTDDLRHEDIYQSGYETGYEKGRYEAGYEAGYNDALDEAALDESVSLSPYSLDYADYVALTTAPLSPEPERNQAAFVIGIIAGFFGIFGLAHLLNGKGLNGLAHMFIGGPMIMFTAAAITAVTLGVGALFAVPYWFYAVYWQAENGAARD